MRPSRRTRTQLLLFGAVQAICFSAPLAAAELTGYVSVTTDYVWRGVTQSDGDPAVQLGADLSYDSGFYFGFWGSTIDIENGPMRQRDRQVNYYAGISKSISRNWTIDGHVVAYVYPGADSDVDYDYTEYSMSLGFDDRVWIEFSYSDDLYGTGRTTKNLEIYVEQPFGDVWTIGGGGGYYDLSNLLTTGYGYWELGISRPVGVVNLDLRYHDANRWLPVVSAPNRIDPRIALTLNWSF